LTEVIVGLVCVGLGALACWLIIRARTNAPGTPVAQAEVKKAEVKEQEAAQESAAKVKDAPTSDIASELERLRARGRAGK
jgi:hypothetical protein